MINVTKRTSRNRVYSLYTSARGVLGVLLHYALIISVILILAESDQYRYRYRKIPNRSNSVLQQKNDSFFEKMVAMLWFRNKEQQQNNALARFVTFESADARVGMSELQAHHCITPEQWSWLLCSVRVTNGKWNVVARIKTLNRNQDPGFRFSRFFLFLVQFQGGNAGFAPPADAHESMKVSPHRISLKHKMFLKKFQIIWQP